MNTFKTLLFAALAILLGGCELSNDVSEEFGQENTFLKLYGGEDNFVGAEAFTTSDGGYIISGNKGIGSPLALYLTLTVSGNTYLVKTDALGNPEWENAYDDLATVSIATSMAIDQEGKFAVVGTSAPTDAPGFPNNNLRVMRIDTDGSLLWSREYADNTEIAGGIAIDIQVASNGDYLVIGYGSTVNDLGSADFNDTDIYALRLSAVDGSIIWERVLGLRSPLSDEGIAIKEDSEGNLIWLCTAKLSVAGNTRMRLIKTDANGNALWDFNYPLNGGEQEASDLMVSNNAYTVFGSEGSKFVLFQTNTNGNLLWSNTLDELEGVQPIPAAMARASDGSLLLSGGYSFNDNYDQILIKASSVDGSLQWRRRFGAADNDIPRGLTTHSDGSIIMSGTLGFESNPLISLIKTDGEGRLSE